VAFPYFDQELKALTNNAAATRSMGRSAGLSRIAAVVCNPFLPQIAKPQMDFQRMCHFRNSAPIDVSRGFADVLLAILSMNAYNVGYHPRANDDGSEDDGWQAALI
jgi:hypothetical protein